ncbi:MAG: DNA alkylation repair protein, partial [candidate division Zixibacteria bacterium]|nr:DNA alkylation repair protein [candidate division Zixibacteria bacterium]
THVRGRIMKWIKSGREFVRATGYSALASALKDGAEISDDDCIELLARIESEIHESPNRARHAMNNAVIAIGVFRPHLGTAAAETARRIGHVEVDHGETSCKTPDAVAYIKKALARKQKRKQKGGGNP